MTEPIDILAHNTAAWNLQAAKDCDWSRPVDSAEIARARAGSWQARLTPGPLPAGWLDDVRGLRILCLAGGGGQQGPFLRRRARRSPCSMPLPGNLHRTVMWRSAKALR